MLKCTKKNNVLSSRRNIDVDCENAEVNKIAKPFAIQNYLEPCNKIHTMANGNKPDSLHKTYSSCYNVRQDKTKGKKHIFH